MLCDPVKKSKVTIKLGFKILLIGNQNHNFFSICRYLREKNYDAHLMLMESETIHHLPASDTYDNNFQEFVKEGKLSRLPSGFVRTEKKYLINLLKDYSFIIGCGLTPAYMNKINRNLDIFIPYGSDLMFQPFLSKKKLFNKKFLKILYQTYHQRNGIKKAKNIISPVTNPIIEEYILKLNYRGNRVFSHIPFIYSSQYKNKTFSDFIFHSKNDVLVDY